MTEEKQEFIHEAENVVEPKEEQTQELNIMDILQMELRRHMEVALEYKKKIDSAQTEYKKKYYTKKLKKNNTEALKVLTAIERVNKGSRKKSDAKKVETDDKHIVA
jgi:hypothetical protein